MNLDELRDFCSSKPGVEECFPFGEETMVFKVMGKMFVLVGMDSIPLTINIKAEPDAILEQREQYSAVSPGYHQNKKYWNTITLDDSISNTVLKRWIEGSYSAAASKLSKLSKDRLQEAAMLRDPR